MATAPLGWAFVNVIPIAHPRAVIRFHCLVADVKLDGRQRSLLWSRFGPPYPMFLKDFPPWNLYVRISEQSIHV
ncbi:hypothetical protein FOQG_19609 [Fusarium oxysporum f. sp. raphani 54005]|uniref:Uncharacterized protein n=1 Tax=Fusarium oxysporum f. sp. raphani 54005 TaxID=1089458 RepID=X0BAV2_FUSOX|nr:hypothetical protein FOQG_19609 [Fusarium oxysporum f. sp. raphani 54005]